MEIIVALLAVFYLAFEPSYFISCQIGNFAAFFQNTFLQEHFPVDTRHRFNVNTTSYRR